MSKNLAITQLAHGDANATPLVLLHDGGGTVLSYQALGPLDRDVYGISDPRFDAGKPWAGGIPEMARAYLQMIKAGISQRNILLGGMCALCIRFWAHAGGPEAVVYKAVGETEQMANTAQAGPLVVFFPLKSRIWLLRRRKTP